MTITKAFTATKVALDRSTAQIDGLLEQHGIRESRLTHQKPLDPKADSGAAAEGSLTLEFIHPDTHTVPHQSCDRHLHSCSSPWNRLHRGPTASLTPASRSRRTRILRAACPSACL